MLEMLSMDVAPTNDFDRLAKAAYPLLRRKLHLSKPQHWDREVSLNFVCTDRNKYDK